MFFTIKVIVLFIYFIMHNELFNKRKVLTLADNLVSGTRTPLSIVALLVTLISDFRSVYIYFAFEHMIISGIIPCYPLESGKLSNLVINNEMSLPHKKITTVKGVICIYSLSRVKCVSVYSCLLFDCPTFKAE